MLGRAIAKQVAEGTCMHAYYIKSLPPPLTKSLYKIIFFTLFFFFSFFFTYKYLLHPFEFKTLTSTLDKNKKLIIKKTYKLIILS